MDNELLVHVHGQGLEVGPPLREMVDGRVREALGHLADKLTRVDVHLRDLNADKGGIDKRGRRYDQRGRYMGRRRR